MVAAWLQLVFAAAPWQLVLEAAAALAQLVLATEPPLVVVVVVVGMETMGGGAPMRVRSHAAANPARDRKGVV